MRDPRNATCISAGHVLHVEDESPNRFLARRALANLGCVISECDTGAAAQGMTRDRLPDVVLVDVQLPDLDGFEVCRRIVADPATSGIPVIIVTSRSGIEDIERGFEAGALDYIRKPYNPREMAVRVRNAIELKRRGDSLRLWKEHVSRDLALAGALQRAVLRPRPMLRENLRIHSVYRPAAEVGGDFFGVTPLVDGRVAVYVGDVAGHGVGPALVATMLHATLQDLTIRFADRGPAFICNELHKHFLAHIDMPSLFATLFLGIVEPASRRWRCLCCGHPSPIVISGRQEDRGALEGRGGPAIGLIVADAQPYAKEDEAEVEMPEDALLLFVSDGLLEALASDDPDSGGRSVVSELAGSWNLARDAEPPCDFVIRRMAELGYHLGEDDCTAVAVEHVGAGSVLFEQRVPLDAEAMTLLASRAEQALMGRGWPAEAAWAVQLIVLEHVANVMRHGRAAAGSSLGLQLRERGPCCEILIRDAGTPWLYADAAPAEPPSTATGGRGILIIRRIAGHIESCRDGAENVTVFTVRRDWKPEAP